MARLDDVHTLNNRPIRVADRLASAAGPLGDTTGDAYDAVGNRASATDAMQRVTTYAYDTLNRLTGING